MEIWDHKEEDFEEKRDKCDSFVVDMESLSNGIFTDINANSRITMQRNLSRKGSQRFERKNTSASKTNFGVVGDGSPKAGDLIGGCTREKSSMINVNVVGVVGSTEEENIKTKVPPQHIITCNVGVGEGRRSRRYGTQRSIWADPWWILLFFASLSSVGTIILIYFTFSVSKLNEDG